MNKYTPNTSEDLSFSILKQHYPHIFNFYQKALKVEIRGFEHELRKKHRTNLKIQFIDDLLLTLGEMVESEIFILIYNGLIDAENLSEHFDTLPTPNEIELIKNTEEDSPLKEEVVYIWESIYQKGASFLENPMLIKWCIANGVEIANILHEQILRIGDARKYSDFDTMYSIVAWFYFEKEFYNYALKRYNELKDSKTASLSSQPTQIKEIPHIKRKILFLTANPRDEQPLRLEGELRKVIDVLNGATHKNSLDYKIEPAVRIDIITKAMQIQKPEIVHFSGHGCVEGLAVEDYSGYSDLFPMEGLDRLFRLFKDTAKCVILNACDSKELAKTISKHGIYTVGMNDEIGDEAARKFAVGFYQSLGEGNNYESSFEIGMVHISNEYDDANTPELWFNGERIRN